MIGEAMAAKSSWICWLKRAHGHGGSGGGVSTPEGLEIAIALGFMASNDCWGPATFPDDLLRRLVHGAAGARLRAGIRRPARRYASRHLRFRPTQIRRPLGAAGAKRRHHA